ncbi:MAG: choice-of-anchor L domain-containing protein [Polyangiales bacterium]
MWRSNSRAGSLRWVMAVTCVVGACVSGCGNGASSAADAGSDGGAGSDASMLDAGTPDTGATDTGATDTGAQDSGGALDAAHDAGEQTDVGTATDAAPDAESDVGVDAGPSLLDQDGDGWTPADGDCCDAVGACAEPAMVNPGAYEFPGNGVDDDCDASTLDNAAPTPCSTAAQFEPIGPLDVMRAMELCQYTSESPPLAQRRWGVVSASLHLADGSGVPTGSQVGVMTAYGPNVTPRAGATFAALSSGTARAPSDPGYVAPQNGSQPGQVGNYNAQTMVSAPAAYLSANGGALPASTCAPPCAGPSCTQAYDSVALTVRIRVPTNARSFSYRMKFYTAEFPEFVCSTYEDRFVTLLSSAAAGLPSDGNIAIDSQLAPMTVNNGFVQVCFPPVAAPPGTCPSGTLELVGTGMGGWGSTLTDGAGTEWLTNTAPVVPGETITLTFAIWDAGDHNVDSIVLLDRFRWSDQPASVTMSK